MTDIAPERVRTGRDGSAIGASAPARSATSRDALKVMVVFGTRPELIKMLPILREIDARPDVTAITVSTSQHVDLVQQLTDIWPVRIDHDLDVMTHGQSLNDIVSRVIGRIDACLAKHKPDVVLVQGDTSSALAAALAAAVETDPGQGGAGTVNSKTLERSNVELSNEFVNMIEGQRAFQANAKTVTTSDEVIADMIQMKR